MLVASSLTLFLNVTLFEYPDLPLNLCKTKPSLWWSSLSKAVNRFETMCLQSDCHSSSHRWCRHPAGRLNDHDHGADLHRAPP